MRAESRAFSWVSSWDLVIIGATVLAVLVALVDGDNPDVDEATATMAAAVIGVAGTFAGHRAGARSSPEGLDRRRKKRRGYYLGDSQLYAAVLAFVLVLLTALVGVGAYLLLPRSSPISDAAAATIFASVVGVSDARFAHERSLSLADRVWVGRGLFTLAIVVSAVLVIWHP